ncbi:MAG: hypothetical protein KIS78_18040 [Labilithrix sp.]|nr:hypothetical protein [Labilithrix sp.]MCW5834305.1 hypothetical protein [Labilithrix sp.]
MIDDSPVFERFVSLAKRELQADDVRMLALGEATPEADNVLVSRLSDGRHVVASFAEAPKDRDALERRLAMLANTFSEALASPPSERTRIRQPVATSLHEELKALAARARALDVVVIDTDSPVVWGCASVPARPRARNELLLREVSDRELASQVDDDSGPLQDVSPEPPVAVELSGGAKGGQRDSSPVPAESAAVVSEQGDDDLPRESEATRRAIAAVRRLPALDGLHKGRHLRHVEREHDFVLALSFSGIYILCLVFDGEFDELRAERAAADALPRIERLVSALPPLDPDPPQPMGGVVALRSRRRR